MPNSTVPAADAGLPNPTRRSALAKLGLGLAASASLVTASAIASPAPAISPELLRLIETHRAAYDTFSYLFGKWSDAGRRGEEPGHVAQARDAEHDLVTAICAFRPSTLEEANLKFRYIFAEDGISHEGLWDEHVKALRKSLNAVGTA